LTYLGIDLGTSGVKVLLIEQDQTIVASGTAPLIISRPKPGWLEQNPADWIIATKTAPKTYAAIKGIGLSGHMHGATLIGDQGQVLWALHIVERYEKPQGSRGTGRGSRLQGNLRQYRVSRICSAKNCLGQKQ